jgi:hypothetical protein
MPNGVEQENIGSNDQQQVEESQTQEASAVSETDAATKRITELEAELEKARNNLQAARRFEKESKLTKAELEAQLAEQGNYKDLYEQAVAKLTNIALDGALTEAAKAAKAKNLTGVLKLIDRSAIEVKDGVADATAVQAAIAKAKQEVPELFEAVEVPVAGRAAEGAVAGGFDKEVRAAKSWEELKKLAAKNGYSF